MLTLHQTLHNDFGVCLWTLLALVVLVIAAVWFIVHIVKQNRREDRFDDELKSNAQQNTQSLREV